MAEIQIAKHPKERSFFGAVFLIAQAIFAITLVAAGTSLVLLWLYSVVLTFVPNSGLMPWVGSGSLAFGLFFILLAACPGVPGIIWVTLLIDQANPPLDRILKATASIGSMAFKAGAMVAILILFLIMGGAIR